MMEPSISLKGRRRGVTERRQEAVVQERRQVVANFAHAVGAFQRDRERQLGGQPVGGAAAGGGAVQHRLGVGHFHAVF